MRPHSQRSTAEIVGVADPADAPEPEALIDAVEAALGTVQAAVKRVDEQAFARLNGANLMFCEADGCARCSSRRPRH